MTRHSPRRRKFSQVLPKSLFAACTEQCVWCKDQWPVTEYRGSIVHVAPFTRDPQLFRWTCDADQIRKGFRYMDYKGGKKYRWSMPTPELLRTMKSLSRIKNISSPENRTFWRNSVEASLSVASWPEWKRSLGSDGNPRPATTPAELSRLRNELLQYDVLDYWARRTCSHNQQYRPKIDKGRILRPDCNDGIGCTGCWTQYERYSDELNKNADI